MANPSPARTPYELIGGDAVLRRVVERFYALMDETPEFRAWLLQKLFGTADWMRNKPGDMPGT